MSPSPWAVRVPASSANLGAGFDVLGLALTLFALVGTGPPPGGAQAADGTHPAAVAFGRLGGRGPLWVRSPIPMGRGLGYSGAVRVGGAAAAVVQRDGRDALADDRSRDEVFATAAALEGHGDNAAASTFGGIVAVADGAVSRVPVAFDAAVLAWVPDEVTTSTERSRGRLAELVERDDAVFNLGRVAAFVAACATGDVAALRRATEDRLHQATRLADVPASAAALEAALAAGAWAAWLSGSGPSVAAFCAPDAAQRIAARLPESGHVKVLALDQTGATVIDADRG